MTPQRRDSLLSGQSTIAKKVYAAVTNDPLNSSSAMDIAQGIKNTTGAGIDIHIMRGCLDTLKRAGLIREVVSGSFRQEPVKEKKLNPTKELNPNGNSLTDRLKAVIKGDTEPMDVLASISARLRAEAKTLNKLADELDAEAIAGEERRNAENEEMARLQQLKEIIKGLR